MIKLTNDTTTTIELLEIIKHLYLIEKHKLEGFIGLLPQLQNAVVKKILSQILYDDKSNYQYKEDILNNWELIEYFIRRGISLYRTDGIDVRQPLHTTLEKLLDDEYITKEILLLSNLKRIGVKKVFLYSEEALAEDYDTIFFSDCYSKKLYTDGVYCKRDNGWRNKLGLLVQDVRIMNANWIISVENNMNSGEVNSSILFSDASRVNINSLPQKSELECMTYSKKWEPKLY